MRGFKVNFILESYIWGSVNDIAPQRSKQNKLHRITEQSKFDFLYMHQIKVHEDEEHESAV